MSQALDGKFSGVVIRTRDGKVIPPDRYIVFMAHDNALPATLDFYRDECARMGVGKEQLAAVDRLRTRLAQWRDSHGDELKWPDALPGECP